MSEDKSDKVVRQELSGKGLSEKQMLQIMRLYDGECGLISRFFTRRLLERSSIAQEFYNDLINLKKEILSDYSDDTNAQDQNIISWQNIQTNIERHERILNTSDSKDQSAGYLADWLYRAGWASLGGAATAVIAFVVFSAGVRRGAELSYTESSAGKTPLYAASSGYLNLDQARSVQNVDYSRSRSVRGRSFRSNVEVDWMRSAGRLRFIQDPVQRSTIIWIKRDTASDLNVDTSAINQQIMENYK